MNQRSIYKALRAWNDVRAVRRTVSTGSTRPVTRRIGRRVYGKVTGRIARRWFG